MNQISKLLEFMRKLLEITILIIKTILSLWNSGRDDDDYALI
jgi:hypothetical protein